jgi:hypothetical protein
VAPEGLGWKAWVFVAAKIAVMAALMFLILGDANMRISLAG